jgi:Tol biopolymer transport system component
LAGSTLRDLAPDYSIDGRIAYTSDRSGSLEVWIARHNGADQVRVTHFNGWSIGVARWSPDGQRLAVFSQSSGPSKIYMMDCAPNEMRCSEPRQIETGNSVQDLSGWSADGRFLYVVADRTGRWEVWKQPIAGGEPIQVTRSGAVRAFESTDGKWLYFSKSQKDGGNSIWRTPGPQSGLAPGREELLIGGGEDIAHEGWRVAPGKIFYVSRTRVRTSETIRAFDLATGRARSILSTANLPLERAVTQIAVSPDSQSVLFSRADKSGSNVMVADFRLGP